MKIWKWICKQCNVIIHLSPNISSSLVKLPLRLGYGWVITSHRKQRKWLFINTNALIPIKPCSYLGLPILWSLVITQVTFLNTYNRHPIAHPANHSSINVSNYTSGVYTMVSIVMYTKYTKKHNMDHHKYLMNSSVCLHNLCVAPICFWKPSGELMGYIDVILPV